VVLVEIDDSLLNQKSIFEIAREKLTQHIKNTEAYSNLIKSDAYKEVLQFKDDLDIAKKNMRDELSAAQNPLLVASRDVLVSLNLIIIRTEFNSKAVLQ